MKSVLIALVALASIPGAASAHAVRHHHHHDVRPVRYERDGRGCEAAHHRSANTGTVLGAVAGGVIGSQMAEPGSRTLGTVLGAGGGAVVGHQIGAHAHRC